MGSLQLFSTISDAKARPMAGFFCANTPHRCYVTDRNFNLLFLLQKTGRIRLSLLDHLSFLISFFSQMSRDVLIGGNDADRGRTCVAKGHGLRDESGAERNEIWIWSQ